MSFIDDIKLVANYYINLYRSEKHARGLGGKITDTLTGLAGYANSDKTLPACDDLSTDVGLLTAETLPGLKIKLGKYGDQFLKEVWSESHCAAFFFVILSYINVKQDALKKDELVKTSLATEEKAITALRDNKDISTEDRLKQLAYLGDFKDLTKDDMKKKYFVKGYDYYEKEKFEKQAPPVVLDERPLQLQKEFMWFHCKGEYKSLDLVTQAMELRSGINHCQRYQAEIAALKAEIADLKNPKQAVVYLKDAKLQPTATPTLATTKAASVTATAATLFRESPGKKNQKAPKAAPPTPSSDDDAAPKARSPSLSPTPADTDD